MSGLASAELTTPPLVDEIAEVAIERWFAEVRAPLRESEHTTRAYQADLRSLLAVAATVLDKPPGAIGVRELAPVPVLRRVFGFWAAERGRGGRERAPRSIKRMHSTWTGFFDYLVSEGLVAGSPMPGIKQPKTPDRQPKPFSTKVTSQLVQSVQDGGAVDRRDPWPELDRAIVLTDLLTGARTAELLGLNVGDVNRTPGSESLRVLGKGNRQRTVPLREVGLAVLAAYLDTRRSRFPASARKRVADDASPWDWWTPNDPLFVGRDGERLTRGQLQYMIQLIYRQAGIVAPSGALTHAMRHTAASNFAKDATVVELMEMFGWNSLSTPQTYVKATGREIREAAGRNPVYGLLAAADDDGRGNSRGIGVEPQADSGGELEARDSTTAL